MAWQGRKPWAQAVALTPRQSPAGQLSGTKSSFLLLPQPGLRRGRCRAAGSPQGAPPTTSFPSGQVPSAPRALPLSPQPLARSQPCHAAPHADRPLPPSQHPPSRLPSPPGQNRAGRSCAAPTRRHLLPLGPEPAGQCRRRPSPSRCRAPLTCAAAGSCLQPVRMTAPRPAAPPRDSHFCFCPDREGAGSRDTPPPAAATSCRAGPAEPGRPEAPDAAAGSARPHRGPSAVPARHLPRGWLEASSLLLPPSPRGPGRGPVPPTPQPPPEAGSRGAVSPPLPRPGRSPAG